MKYNSRKPLSQDNVYTDVILKSTNELTGMPSTSRLANAVISNGKLVNVVSDRYALIENQQLYTAVEERLINADVEYKTSSFNKNDCSFAVDYILENGTQRIGDKDIIQPLFRFTNSYDGTCKTQGTFGLFRQVCSNGLHIAVSEIEFNFKHTKNNASVLMPRLDELINHYLATEYYELNKKINHLSDVIIDPVKFTQEVCDRSKLFSYEKNKRNTDVSDYANRVINTILSEAEILNVQPSAWLGYNAFNEVLHGEMNYTFNVKQEKDASLFSMVYNDYVG
jgi:hypothetical protein